MVPLLSYPDISKSYTLYTKASHYTVGAVLTHSCNSGKEIVLGEKPSYSNSHKLSSTQKKWSTLDKEAFVVHYALQKLLHYLHDVQFTIKTNHQPLKYLLQSEIKNGNIWMMALNTMSYNAKIKYLPGG